MKRITVRSTKTLLACAALAGIMSGGVATKASARDYSGQQVEDPAPDKAKCETHSCAGKNSCKGKGGCKSGDNKCAGKNSCQGKGGCAVKEGKPVHTSEKK